MTDRELIEAGKKLAVTMERDQIELGRLALEYAPIGEQSVKVGTYTRIREYADAIGMEEGTLRNCRTVVHAWRDVDHEGFGFSLLKACAAVAHKEDFIAALRDNDPFTKSGRWTAAAALQFAKDNGFWTHSTAARRSADVVLEAIRTSRASIAKLANLDLSYEEATDALMALGELRLEVELLQRNLSGRAAKRDEDLAAA